MADEPSLASMINIHDPKVQKGLGKLVDSLPDVPEIVDPPQPIPAAEYERARSLGLPQAYLDDLALFDSTEDALEAFKEQCERVGVERATHIPTLAQGNAYMANLRAKSRK